MQALDIATRKIGPGFPCFVIAEAGVNHNGDPALAARLVDAAAEAGADAVKFQTFRADRLASPEAPQAEYQARNSGVRESQADMLRRLELSPDAHRALRDRCAARGLLFLSTPFEDESADFLVSLGVPLLKIPSGEITNLPFLEHVARAGLPLIVSTGMADLGEVREAVGVLRSAHCPGFALLHCVSSYPAPAAHVNLRALQTLRDEFDVPVGYSDHTEGIEIALAAAALGACVLEKHFTLDRALPGPDHKASLEPGELAALIRGVRAVQSALGDGLKRPAPGEAETAAVIRKSVVAARAVPRGAVLAPLDLAVRRPGTGLSPGRLPSLIGLRARRDLRAGAPIGADDVEPA
jgi:N-acetylneuraminate synthase